MNTFHDSITVFGQELYISIVALFPAPTKLFAACSRNEAISIASSTMIPMVYPAAEGNKNTCNVCRRQNAKYKQLLKEFQEYTMCTLAVHKMGSGAKTSGVRTITKSFHQFFRKLVIGCLQHFPATCFTPRLC